MKKSGKTTLKNLVKSFSTVAVITTISFASTVNAVEHLEKENLKLGFIKLTDMAPLAVAFEKGARRALREHGAQAVAHGQPAGLVVDLEEREGGERFAGREERGRVRGRAHARRLLRFPTHAPTFLHPTCNISLIRSIGAVAVRLTAPATPGD